jgi:hypothetical protein
MLASNDVAGYRYYSCEGCRGLWIPGASLHRALSARGVGELRAAAVAHAGGTRQVGNSYSWAVRAAQFCRRAIW